MFPAIFAHLSADPTVTALLGAGSACRVKPFGEAKPDIGTPYVTWLLVTGDPENSLSDTPGADRFIVQFDVWADEQMALLTVAQAVRNSVERLGQVIAYNPSDRDPDTNRYRYSFDVEFMTKR